MSGRLAVDALVSAVSRRGPAPGCIVHSDRDSQFRADSFVEALQAHHLIGEIGRVGATGDNAAMEWFFSLMQENVQDRRRWHARQPLRIAIIAWIERTEHRRQGQVGLG